MRIEELIKVMFSAVMLFLCLLIVLFAGLEEDMARQVCRGLKAEFSEFFIPRSDSDSANRHSLPVCLLRRETQGKDADCF